MKYLVTGGCGFLGSNLAFKVLQQHDDLCVFDNLYRLGATTNLEWLQSQGEFRFLHGDIRNSFDVTKIVQEFTPDVVFHLAAQVAVTTSLENPRFDFEVNIVGTFNLLEAVRKYSPGSIVVYSSTNKVYGDLKYLTYEEDETRHICKDYPVGFDESLSLDFHSPYGCSKGAADQYMLDYARMYGLKTIVFRHSSIYGPRQFSTFDQGWIGWFCRQAIEFKQYNHKELFTISGDGKQVRDVLYISDIMNCYFAAVDRGEKLSGEVFNIGGGIKNSLSLMELFNFLEKHLDVTLKFTRTPSRLGDQLIFVANIRKAEALLGWKPEVNYTKGILDMISWVEDQEFI